MVRVKILSLIFLLIISLVFVYAEESGGETQNKQSLDAQAIASQGAQSGKNSVEIGPGMEAITISGASILVPKDMIVTQKKGRVKKEDIGAYMGRKFDEIDKRFSSIESKQGELKAGIEEIKKELEELVNNRKKGEGK